MNINAAPKQGDIPVAVLENPVNGQKVSGILPIYGWALDKKGITQVEFFIDDQSIGNIPYGGTRMDVKNAYPDYPKAENSGFAMIWNYSILTSGDHSIKVRVHNQDGLTRDLDAMVTVKKFHGEFVDKLIPGERRLNNNVVTVGGIDKTYDIKIDWSNASQGFQITDVIPK
jgi:N-acetylmuramoyl-L-alanine amidase